MLMFYSRKSPNRVDDADRSVSRPTRDQELNGGVRWMWKLLLGNSSTEIIFIVGDNFYFNGVKDEYDKRFQETYDNIFNQDNLQIPWYAVAGNHDHYGNASAQIAYSAHSSRWTFPDYWYSQKWLIPGTVIE